MIYNFSYNEKFVVKSYTVEGMFLLILECGWFLP